MTQSSKKFTRSMTLGALVTLFVAIAAVCLFPVPILRWLANFDVSNGNYHEGLHKVDIALMIDPKSAELYYYRAQLYQTLNERDDALMDLNKAIEVNRNAKMAYPYYLSRGWMEHSAGQFDAALSDYQRCLDLEPNSAEVYGNLADIYFRLGNVAKSLDCCNKALKAEPYLLLGRLNRAQCYLRMKQYEKCLADALKSIELNQATDPQLIAMKQFAQLLRASAYRGLGNEREAKICEDIARSFHKVSHDKIDEAIVLENQFKFKVKRSRFTLCTNSDMLEATRLADFADRFLTYVDTNICPVKIDSSFHIFVFATPEELPPSITMDELKTTNGTYDSALNAVVVYKDSGLGTVAHELMHKVLESKPFIDEWAKEGIPAMFDKFYAYNSANSLVMDLGVQNNLSKVKRDWSTLQLAEVLAEQWPRLSSPEERLAAVFLYKSGSLPRYFQLCENGELGSYATYFEAAFGANAPDMQQKWSGYLRTIAINREAIDKLPDSKVFANQAEYDKFVREHADGLHFVAHHM